MRKFKMITSVLLTVTLIVSFLPSVPALSLSDAPVRTVMMFCCGSDLESGYGFASENLIQAMQSDYNENLNFIVMTGGASKWNLSRIYLTGAAKINPQYNQVWKLDGKTGTETHGKMTLLEPKGLSGYGLAYMSDYTLLTAFIDYCYENYPADIYDLIIWDHGGGPVYGFSFDERTTDMISLSETVEAFSATELYKSGGKFDFIDFDTCLMCSVEFITALSAFTDVLVCSPEEEPGGGQYYTNWLNVIKMKPRISAFDIGRIITDDFIEIYTEDNDGYLTVMSVVDIGNFNRRMLPYITELSALLAEQAKAGSGINGLLNVYDELSSLRFVLEYGSMNYDLIDLGQLAGVLSCPQSEIADLDTDMITGYENLYTECALHILEALNDRDNSGDDVVYSRYINGTSKKINGLTARTFDGTVAAVSETDFTDMAGISIFFPSETPSNTCDYIEEMILVSDLLPDGDGKDLLEIHMLTSAYYGLLIPVLQTAAEMSDGGGTVTFDAVKAKLIHDGPWSPRCTYLISRLIEAAEFGDVEQVEEYLSDAVDGQIGLTVSGDKASVKQVRNAGGGTEGYRLTLSDSAAQLISDVFSGVRIITYPRETRLSILLARRGYTYSELGKYFPNGMVFDGSRISAERDYASYTEAYGDGEALLKKRAYADTDYITYLKRPSADHLVTLHCADGADRVAWVYFTNGEKTEGYIPVILTVNLISETDCYLYIELENGEWKTKGLSLDIAPEDEREYYDVSQLFTGTAKVAYAPAAYMTDSIVYNSSLIPTAAFADAASAGDFADLTVSAVSEEDIGSGAVNVERFYCLTDIFGFATDLTDSIAASDEAAAEGVFVTDIGGASVTVAEASYDGEEQRPAMTVSIGGKTLTEGDDYRVLYDGSTGPGEAHLLILGAGEYCGAKTVTYEITANTALQGDVNGDGAVNGKDLIRLRRYLVEFGGDPSEITVVIFPGSDLNGDGVVNGKDLIRLRKLLVEA